MQESMEKVTRYKCKWCGKEFKTPHLHKCKWDPMCKNCLSCAHNCGYIAADYSHFSPYTGDGEVLGPYVDCDRLDDPTEGGNYNEVSDGTCYSTKHHDTPLCPHWILLPGYEGRKSYRKHLEERQANGLRINGQETKEQLTIESYIPDGVKHE